MNDKYWETGKCPKCGEDLLSETHKEYRDCQILIPMYEEVTYWYCPNCGWSDGNSAHSAMVFAHGEIIVCSRFHGGNAIAPYRMYR